MILELNGTKVTIVDKTLGYQGDNLVNTIQVTVDKDSTWNYKLDMYKGKSKCFDSVLMTRDGNVCTVQLTNEILSYGGRYIFQFRGYTDTQTYHSDIFESWVNASIEYQGNCKQACECDCKLPTEFYQVEDNVTEINNHPPYPGDNGKWMIWDVDKHEYVESDIEVVGGGTDISLGITSAAVGDIVKVKAVDASGKPTEWEALGFRKIREFTLPDDPSTDTSDITYKMCTLEGFTDKIAQCIFSTDDEGNSFSVMETILVAKWGYARINNYYGMADQNGGVGYGNIFSNRLNNNQLRTFVYYTCLEAGMRFTARFEKESAMNNIAGIYTTPVATDDYAITAIKIGTFLDQAMLSGSSFVVYGR